MEISRGHPIDLYKVTYIRHLKSRNLSVTKLTQKRNGLFVTKMREFSVKMGSFGGMYMKIWGVLTQKGGLWVTDDKNYGTSSKTGKMGPGRARWTYILINDNLTCYRLRTAKDG